MVLNEHLLSRELGCPICMILLTSGASAPMPYASVANNSLVRPSGFVISLTIVFLTCILRKNDLTLSVCVRERERESFTKFLVKIIWNNH